MGEGVSTSIEVKGVNLVSGSSTNGAIDYGLGVNEIEVDAGGASSWGAKADAVAKEGASFMNGTTFQAATDGTIVAGTTYYKSDGNGGYTAIKGSEIGTGSFAGGGKFEGVDYFTINAAGNAVDGATVKENDFVKDAAGNYTKVTAETLSSMKVNGGSASIDASLQEVENAVAKLREVASDFGSAYSIIETRQDFTENLINVLRQDFTENLINVLTEGADSLTLADMNEESANMLALQTRQQLAINALSLSSQANQAVLSLF